MRTSRDNSASRPPDSPLRYPTDAEYWLALTRLPGIGRATFLRLVEAYQSPRAAWERTDDQWRSDRVVRADVVTIGKRAPALAWARDQLERLAKSEWSLVVYGGSAYPAAMSVLRQPPPFLFVRGEIPGTPALAVVGSRQPSAYGLRVARQIAADVAAAGVTIISGFARGIDTVAHQAAIEADGATVAVWGCGPDVVYPRDNESLIPSIVERGAVITEFPFGMAPEPQNFPVRNRLIAALAQGVLVAEARSRSGALLTAQEALDQGKDVYAVPGEIGRPQSVGANELIKSGARMVTSAQDILSDMGVAGRRASVGEPPNTTLPPLTPLEMRVREGLGSSPCQVDRLAVSLQMSAAECAAVLVSLELKGIVKQQAGHVFARIM